MASLIVLNSALLDEKRMGLSVFLNAQDYNIHFAAEQIYRKIEKAVN